MEGCKVPGGTRRHGRRVVRDAWNKAAAVVVSTRGLYRKLTPLQKVALLLVGCGMMGSLGMMAFAGRARESSKDETSESEASRRGPWDPAGQSPPKPATWSGSDFLLSLEPPGTREWRLLEANRVMLEHALVGGKVERATVIYMPASDSPRVLGPDREASAAVLLCLSRDADLLERQEADGLRDLVVHALRLEREKVCLRDDRGNTYPAAGSKDDSLPLYESEEALRTQIRNEIMDYYARLYSPGEYYVAVTVYLSLEEKVIDTTEYDPEKSARKKLRDNFERNPPSAEAPKGGIGPCAVAHPEGSAVIASELEEEMLVSTTRTQTNLPPGATCSVSVNVLVDLEAALRNQALEPDLTGGADDLQNGDAEWLLAAYQRSQEEAISNLLRVYKDSSVKVEFQPFVKAERIVAPETARVPFVAAPSGKAAMSPWIPVLLGFGTALGASALVVALRRRRRGRSGRFRQPSEWSGAGLPGLGRVAGMSVGEALSGRMASAKSTGLRGEVEDGILRTVGDTISRVQKRPEVAAAVLRSWLRQDLGEPQGGASRS
jgi:flagellar biosynthesis/type III secretory pathway M-ring protein FliF/YscJ